MATDTVKVETLFGTMERPRWEMPEWMEPYRDVLPAGDRAEELMNATDSVAINAPRALMATAMKAAVDVLARMHERGLLAGGLSDIDAKALGPFARDSETSRAAAIAAYPKQGTDRWKILYLLDLAGKNGMPGHTRDEIAKHTGLSPNTVRPRVKELIDGRWIEPAMHDGERLRRPSDSGRASDVLWLSELAREAIRREREDERRARFDAAG